MTEYFTVPEGMEPTFGQVKEAMKRVYDEQSRKFPQAYPDDEQIRGEWIRDMYPTYLHHARAKVGMPLDTVPYDRDLPDYGDMMTVEEWLGNVEGGGFIDYDGHGHPAKAEYIEWKDGMNPRVYPTTKIQMAGNIVITPSMRHLIPEDATHIVWFNR